jgi:hypothetical protein
MLDHTESLAIEWAVQQTGSLPRAARLLGVSRAHIYKRVDALDLRHLIQQKRDDDLHLEHEIAEEAPETPEESVTEEEEGEEDTPDDDLDDAQDTPEEAYSETS